MNPENSPFKKPFENIQNKLNQAAQASGPAFVFDKFVAIALVVGIVVGFLIGHGVASNSAAGNNASSTNGFLFFGGKSSSTAEVKNLEDVQQEQVADVVVVNDQSAGSSVVISSLTLDNTYWVAVRDNSDTTNTPYILGARRVKPGTYTDLSVYVSRKTEAGKKYEVVFYKDSIDFNYSASSLLTSNDKVIRASFEVK